MKSPRQDLGQVSVQKTSESKPFEDASLRCQVSSKPVALFSHWDKSAGSLMTGRTATGV